MADARSERSRWTGPWATRIAWALWAAVIVGASIAIAVNPKRTVTHNYRDAARAFIETRQVYSPGQTGWLYPIQSAQVFAPFAFEPRVVSEVLWRVVCIGLLAAGVRRLARRCNPRSQTDPPLHDLFLLISGAAIPPALSAARNGQTNLLIAAVLVHACVEIMDRRWWWAAAWLGFSLAAKPIAIVGVLLYTALHRPLWWRIPLALLAVAAMPFLHPNWDYVIEQYAAGLRKVGEAAAIKDFKEFHPADLTSLLHLVGIPPGGKWLTVLRGLIAIGVLGCCWRAMKLFDHATSAVLTLTFACAYLMVFNPRTEANSYVILGPPLAVLAAWSLVHNRSSRRSIILVGACVLLGWAQFLVYRQREYWIRPAETIVIMVWLGAAILVPKWRRTVPVFPSDPDEEVRRGTVRSSGNEPTAEPQQVYNSRV